MTEISASARDAHEVKQEAAEVQESKTVKINDEEHARGTADTARIEDRHFEKRHLDVQMYARGSRGGHWDPPEEVVDIERSR